MPIEKEYSKGSRLIEFSAVIKYTVKCNGFTQLKLMEDGIDADILSWLSHKSLL